VSPALRGGALVAGTTALAVGGLTALQSRVNGELASVTNSGVQAALVSFGTGWILLTIILIASPAVRRGLVAVGHGLRQGQLRWWQVLGGLLGGFFVAVQSATVPLIGVAVFTVAVVAGQVSNSIVVDRLGLGPAGRQAVTPTRIISALLAVLAVLIAVSDRLAGGVEGSTLAVIAALIAGLAIAVQQAINGRVGASARNAWTAAWINFTLGAALLGATLGIAWGLTDFDPGVLPTGPWWLYAGGTIGVLFIAAAAWVVQRLGVLLFALLTIAGQLTGALLLDWLAPAQGVSIHLTLIVGVVLAAVAVAVGSLSSWGPRLRRAVLH
jgi:bacterial/archaeal transporter family-2 protein